MRSGKSCNAERWTQQVSRKKNEREELRNEIS